MTLTEIKEYVTEDGRRPFPEWLHGLKDRVARTRIVARLDRFRLALFGDWKAVGRGVSEARFDIGPATAFTSRATAMH